MRDVFAVASYNLVLIILVVSFVDTGRFAFAYFVGTIFSVTIVYQLYTLRKQRQLLPYAVVLLLVMTGATFVSGYALFYYALREGCSASECAQTFSESLYFSVVTATTLGYGDFAPTVRARPMAATQAVTGYVFLGFAIAQFMGVRTAKS